MRCSRRGDIKGHIKKGQRGVRIFRRYDRRENAANGRRIAKDTQKGQLVDEALLLRGAKDFAETEYEAGDAENNEQTEDYQAPEEQFGRRAQAVFASLQIIAAAWLSVV